MREGRADAGMRCVETVEEIRESSPGSLALGAFDGLHLGHQAVIRAALEPGPWEPGVFTFRESPAGGPMVLTAEDKAELLRDAGVKRLYSMEFSAVRDISPREFVQEVLFRRCRAKRLCCGEDFRFGRGGQGDVSLLRELCAEAGVELAVTPPVVMDGEKISSTRIRAAVERGEIPLANRLLGRPFGFSLEVIHGNHIGTGLGTPTINQVLPEHFVLPPFGVYASWAQVREAWYYGVTNIGVKPTVGSDRVLSETWMPEFSGDLYGRQVRLCLLQFLRPERKFSSLEALKAEILNNAAQAKAIAGGAPQAIRSHPR